MIALYILGGFALLIAGGEMLVRGAVSIAERFKVSPLLIGLTLVGFGTSTPELVTSLNATLSGSPGIALGNVVGSNTANILLILGAAAAIAPIAVARKPFILDGGVATLAAILCAAAVLSGTVGRFAGVAFLAVLVAYLVASYQRDRREVLPDVGDELGPTGQDRSMAAAAAFFIAGLGATVLGADFLVEGSVALARQWGASEALIGVTIVAIGTSLPELATSVISALRGQSDIALGNIIGSNIFNVFGILGVTALVQPLSAPAEISGIDIWVMLGGAAALVATAATGWRISRWEGGLLLASYLGYLTFRAVL